MLKKTASKKATKTPPAPPELVKLLKDAARQGAREAVEYIERRRERERQAGRRVLDAGADALPYRITKDPYLLTVPESANYLKCSDSSVWRWLREGRFPRRKISAKMTRIALPDLEAYVRSRTTEE
jgi:excisionase family DNA binding protein